MATNRKRSTRTSRSSTARSTSTQSRPVSDRDEAADAARSLAWDNEYQYIKKDLRQLSVVSVLLVTLLLVVGFII